MIKRDKEQERLVRIYSEQQAFELVSYFTYLFCVCVYGKGGQSYMMYKKVEWNHKLPICYLNRRLSRMS